MFRVGVTAKEIFEAAETLVAKGQTPTQEKIRQYLGRGSRGTVHKYFKQWKQHCFKQKSNSSKVDGIDAKTLFEEKYLLEKAIENQIAKNALLTEQLVESGRDCMRFQAENQQLKVELAEIKEQYLPLKIKHQSLEEAYQTLKEGQDKALQAVIIDKNQHIESLRQELKEVNETSLAAVRDIGYQADDALMREKVKAVHLTDEVSLLQKTIAELKKQLLDAQFKK